jgi:hypothetical protein
MIGLLDMDGKMKLLTILKMKLKIKIFLQREQVGI